jgi:hypothetical protein
MSSFVYLESIYIDFQDALIMIVSGQVINIKMAAKNRPDRTFKTALLFWHKGNVRRAAQRRIAELLAKPIESRIFESLPPPAFTQSIDHHVCWVRRDVGLMPYFLFFPRWQPYRVEDAYKQGRAESDGQYSPHTAFRSLRTGNILDAVDFVNEFGPLELLDESEPRRPVRPEDLLDFDELICGEEEPGPEEEPAPRERCVWVDVDDFWKKQQRFVAVVKLWESRETPQAIRSALSELATLPVNPQIGARRYPGGVIFGSAFPWDYGFHKWAHKADDKQLIETAVDIIARELDLNTDRMRLSWVCRDPSQLQFNLVPYVTSLWSAIWHLFARDTSAGVGWRICPHCSKLFYPKRKDSYFCEPRYQKLHAANRWWSQHSEEELDKRRKRRSKRRPIPKGKRQSER